MRLITKNIKIILVLFIGIVVQFLLVDFLAYYKLAKPNLAWGITIYYSYFFFGTIYMIATLCAVFLKRKAFLLLCGSLFFLYILYCYPSLSSYPNRTCIIILVNLMIFVVGQLLMFKARKNR
mgnify:CR=1 FL=1